MSDNEDFIEDEAGQEEDKFEDSSEEDEDEDKFEEDDFIVNDDPDDIGDDDDMGPPLPRLREVDEDAKRKKKKKRRRYREDSQELAEGDLQLLEEGGVRIGKKKLKRLRKGASDDEDNARLSDDVAGLADEDEEEDRYLENRRRADAPVDFDDDMDDFIDDGGRSRRRRAAEREGLVSSDAVRQARSIFGDVDEMDHYQGGQKLFKGGADGDDEEDADYAAGTSAKEESVKPLRTIRERDTDRFDEIEEDAMPRSEPAREEEAIVMELSGPVDNTEDVKRICETDIPEQLQYHFGRDYKAPTEPRIQEEAEWIFRRGFKGNPLYKDKEDVTEEKKRFSEDKLKKRIVVVLSYIHIDKLDIPFIAMYRKDYINPCLIHPAGEVMRKAPKRFDYEQTFPSEQDVMKTPQGFNSYRYDDLSPHSSFEHKRGVAPGYDDGFGDWSILWHILDLDKKYANMLRRRRSILTLARDAAEKGVPALVIEDVKAVAKKSETDKELNDAEQYLRLAMELAQALDKDRDSVLGKKGNERGRRPLRRKHRYGDFCKQGYRDLANEFGISARQVGENLKGASEYEGTQMHVPIDAEDEPLSLAATYGARLGAGIDNPHEDSAMLAEKLLESARYIFVTEVAADMQVSQAARDILCKPGTVSVTTTPTVQGIAQVNDTHPLRRVTSLFEKKLESFRNSADFILLRRAVDMGFTNMEIVLQPEQVSQLEKNLAQAILVSEVEIISPVVEAWNKERLLVVNDVKLSLIKKMKEEVAAELLAEATESLRSKMTQSASRRFLLGPGRPYLKEDGCPRVLAFSVTSEDDEEPDALQIAKDAEQARENGQMVSERRIARERLTIVDLDENGEYQNGYEMFAGWLRRPMRGENARLPNHIRDQLKSFIMRSKAHLIVIGIGSGGRSAVRLQSDMVDVIREMAMTKTEDDERSQRPLMLTAGEVAKLQDTRGHLDFEEAEKAAREIIERYVILVDEFPARIYAKTNWSTVGLTMDAMTLLEKRAIALARLAQEPLWIYTAIGQEKEHALHLKFHPYHYYAKPADRMISLRRALFRAVCANGVDINRILRLPHMQPMIAYVGGLGVHKGKALIKALENVLGEEDRGLQSRKHLWSQNYLGRTVFLSVAAFLRVRDPDLHSGGSTKRAIEVRRSKLGRKARGRRRDDDGGGIFDPMDDSRIHPEHYAVAIKIADEALRDDDGNLRIEIHDSEEYTESIRMTAAVMDDPEGLSRLALDEYAKHLENRGRGCLYETVKTIASEFQGPYKDHRCALVSPSPEAMFYIVSGADAMTVRRGSEVTATECELRTRRKEREDGSNNIVGIACRLPNDIRGFVRVRDFSDDRLSDAELRQLVPDGSAMRCRILDISHHRFEASLASKMSLVEDPRQIQGYTPLVDITDDAYRPYPKQDKVGANGVPLGGMRGEKGGTARTRERINLTMSRLRIQAKSIVQHPLFRNIPGQEAISELRTSLPGDIIIRPSQYDKDSVVFSCNFATDLPGMDTRTTHRGVFHKECHMDRDPDDDSVPLRLRVDDNLYEDVEQLLEQYLRPIISNLSESLDHRKFKSGRLDELEAFVVLEKKKSPRSIPYVFGLSTRKNTNLVLVYIPGTITVMNEEIQVVPDGYRLRSVLHANMDVLITWFKKNMRKGVPSRRPVTVREQPAIAASPFAAVASPFREVAKSPFQGAASPFHGGAKSPFQSGARSPFHGGASSPFHGGASSPFNGGSRTPIARARSPYTAVATQSSYRTGSRSPYIAKPQATPARDVPPPPAPGTNSSMLDPYKYNAPSRPSRYDDAPQVNDMEWQNATKTRDEPPPSVVQNGNYGRDNSRRQPEPGNDRGRYDPIGPTEPHRDGRSPPPELRRAEPRRPQHPKPQRPQQPEHQRELRGPPSRDSRAPADRRAGPPGDRNAAGGPPSRMPNWRGKAPVPAWKKALEAEEQGEG